MPDHDSPCAFAQRLEERITACEGKVDGHGVTLVKVFARLDQLVESVNTRLPAWAVALIAFLTAALGWYAKK